jgi:hypothetical protein
MIVLQCESRLPTTYYRSQSSWSILTYCRAFSTFLMTDQPVATLYLRSAVECATSIAEQRQACGDHATAQGWTIGETFADDGASAPRHGGPEREHPAGPHDARLGV